MCPGFCFSAFLVVVFYFEILVAMKYVALAILLAVLQTAPPPPRKASGNASSSGKSIKQDSGNLQTQPVAATPPTDKQSGEPPSDTHAANNDTEIQGKIKTFTGLLVVVGFLQFFARRGQ